jgi:TRAP-type C4-dicarboxylate transport system permease small subunit
MAFAAYAGQALKNLERRLTAAEEGILVALLLFMVLMSFLQVILRVFFSTGILWADTLLRHLVLWVGFLGACLAASAGRQFAMDASDRVLKGRVKTAVHLLCHAFTAVVCLFLLQASITFFREEYVHSETLLTVFGRDIPAWTLESILPIGFALLLVHYLIKTALTLAQAEDHSA